MIRPPGDISHIESFDTNVRTIRAYNGSVAIANYAVQVLDDLRPYYPYGNISMIGGKLWRYPTMYKHFSRVSTGTQGYAKNVLSDGRYSEVTYTHVNGASVALLQLHYDLELGGVEKYNVTSAAKVKALNAIGDAKANLGEDLATYLQTVRMFKSKVTLLRSLLHAFKKGKLGKYINRSARDLLRNGDKIAANAYLEYVYGWKPLVSDIYEIYQMLKRYSSGSNPVIIHGHGGQTQSSNNAWEHITVASSVWATASVSENYHGSCDLYGRIDPDYLAFRVLNQLGLLNPAALAWELTPWSFVVDWLLPIGPVLQALSAPIGVNFISGSVSTRLSRTIEGDYHVSVKASNAVSFIDRPGRFKVVDEFYERAVLTSWPFPTPYLNLNPLSGDRSYKALALLISNLRK